MADAGKCEPWAVTVSWIVYTMRPTGMQCELCSRCLPFQDFYLPFQIISVNSANRLFALRLAFTLSQPAVSWAFSHICQTAQIVARPALLQDPHLDSNCTHYTYVIVHACVTYLYIYIYICICIIYIYIHIYIIVYIVKRHIRIYYCV